MKRQITLAAATTALLVTLCPSAHAQHLLSLRIPTPELRTSDAPALWRRVSLGPVHGVSSAAPSKRGYRFVLDKAPTQHLADLLRRRMRSQSGAVGRLAVTDLQVALHSGGRAPRRVGLSATLVLQRPDGAKKRIALEHSVFCAAPKADKCRTVYARAMVDLTDRILFDSDVLTFFGGKPARLADSALLTRSAVGPMLRLGRRAEALATSRTLWSSMDLDTGGFLEMRAGEAFSAVVGAKVRYWYGGWGLRVDVGLGASKQPSFLAQADLGLDFGYRGVKKSGGYVLRPGLSVLVSPRSAIFFSSNGGGVAVLYGGSVELEAYFSKDVGAMAGFFGGGATIKDVITATGTFFPYFELFFHSKVGKFALGLNLRRFQYNAPVFGGGALLTFSWTAHVGRGVDAAGSRVVAAAANQAARGRFDGRGSALAPAQRRRLFASERPAPALSAPTPAATPHRTPATPTSSGGVKAPNLEVLVARVATDAALGKAAATVLRSTVVDAFAALGARAVDAEQARRVAKLLGVGALDKPEHACAVAKSTSSGHALFVSAALASDKTHVKLTVSLHAATDSCAATAASKTVPRLAMIATLRALVSKLVSAAARPQKSP